MGCDHRQHDTYIFLCAVFRVLPSCSQGHVFRNEGVEANDCLTSIRWRTRLEECGASFSTNERTQTQHIHGGGGGVARIQSLKHMVLRRRVQTRSSQYSRRPHSKRLADNRLGPVLGGPSRTLPSGNKLPLPGLHLLGKPC